MSLRELLLLPVASVLCLVALVRPRVGLYAYVWWALMRPDILAFAEDKYPFSLLLAITTGIGSIPYLGRLGELWRNPISRLLIALQVPFGLSVLFAIYPELTYERYGYYIRMILVIFLIPVLIETEEHLQRLLLTIVLSLGFIGLRFGLYGVIHGGVELAAGYGDMLADNNFVALGFAMLIPAAWYCRQWTSSRWIKAALFGITLFCIPAIVMSNSRGGILSMTLGILCIWHSTKRKIISVILISLVLGGAIYLVQDMFTQRMATLAHPEDEESAAGRIALGKVAVQIWQEYPILGVGFGSINFSLLATQIIGGDKQLVAHDTYLQLLVDSGIFALILYVVLIGFTIVTLGRSASLWRSIQPQRAAMARAIQIPLIVFSLDATFYSCYRMDLPYMFIMCGAVWYTISRRSAQEHVAPEEIPYVVETA